MTTARECQDVLCEVLAVEQLDPEKTWTQSGGTSLTAMVAASRLTTLTGHRVSPSVLTSSPLGVVLDTLGSGGLPPAERAQPVATLASSPLSWIQQWALDGERAAPDRPNLQFTAAYDVRGALDVEALASALQCVVGQHPGLRVRYDCGATDEMVLETAVDEALLVEVGQSPSWPDALAVLQRALNSPFDASAPARIRLVVQRVEEQRHAVALVFDHRTVDGWSMKVALEDISTAYASLLRGESVVLPDAGSLFEWVAKEQDDMSRRTDAAVDFYSSRLPSDIADYSLVLPGRSADPSMTEPGSLETTVPVETARRVDDWARRTGSSRFVVATAALARALWRLTGRDAIRINTAYANRGESADVRTVGWLASTLIPVYEINEDVRTDDALLVEHVREQLDETIRHALTPSPLIRQRVYGDQLASAPAPTGVYFAFDDEWTSDLTLPGCTATAVELEDRADALGVQVYMTRAADRWTIASYFHRGEYPDGIDDLIEALLVELAGIGDHPEDDS